MSETVKSDREYPLVVEHCSDDSGDPISMFAKGHTHSERHFLRRAGVELASQRDDVYTSLLGKPVTYHWRRKRPALPHEPYAYWLDDAEPGTPGAFPIMEVFVG